MKKPTLLIVEDDEAIRTQLKYALRDDYLVSFAEDRARAMVLFHELKPDVVTLDLGLPPSPDTAEEGLKVLEEMVWSSAATKVIVVTGNSDRENGLRATQLGAFDYCAKPIDVDELAVVLRRAVRIQDLEDETEQWVQRNEEAARFEEIIGTTLAMRVIYRVIQRVAKTDATVLIQGESGTGKELVARAVHWRSRRRDAPFVAINCGAIPEALLEAELFGHERGAFTGAHVQRRGKFELAQRGTLFLDEIAELSVMLQVKLLRFLQERTIERVGGRELIPLDLRVIAATNRDLKAQLEKGAFREDLYYRLSVVTIHLPPLRERSEDTVLLANTFLRRAAQEHRRRVRFSAAALRALNAHGWPGNIRELENRVGRAVIMAAGRLIEPADLDLAPAPDESPAASLRGARAQVERDAVVEALVRQRGNISRAARDLEVSRPTLHDLLRKHQVNARDFR
jgi:two-component system, NtrC family, response regulator